MIEKLLIIAVVQLVCLLLVAISAWAISRIFNKKLLVRKTLQRLIIAAVLGNILSFIVYKIFHKVDYFWGEIPLGYKLLYASPVILPAISVILTLLYSLKKDQTTLHRNPEQT